MSCKENCKLCHRKKRPTINRNPRLPLYSIINTDVTDDNTTVEVQIGYSSNRFSNKSKVTYSNKTATSDFNNILLVGSSITQTKPDRTLTLQYGLPLIIYRQGNTNSTSFINNLSESFNFHPHGLACDAFVDGASALNEFGRDTQIGNTLSLKYPIVNNSMFSAWHTHPMFNSSPLLYGNIIMPYVVKDWASDLLEPYFTLNQNDIPIAFSAIDCDNSGKLNSARLYSYPCINLRVNKAMKDAYPNISSKPIDGSDNIISYCSSLGAWRGTFLQINGQITGAYTPNKFCQNIDDTCANGLLCSNPECTNKYSQILTHVINNNLLRLRLVHAGSSFRRSCFGFIDENHNFLDFWVIGAGGGFDRPWVTKMISLESMNRADVIIDITQGSTTSLPTTHQRSRVVYLVAFDFDITLMEKAILFQPYLEQHPDTKYDYNFFKHFSIYTGCLLEEETEGKSIFNNEDCRHTFLDLLNKLRPDTQQTDTLPYFKTVKFNYLPNHKRLVPVDEIINIINNKILIKPDLYYFNYPGIIESTRNITMSSGMQFQVDSWLQDDDIPSLKFKFSGKSKFMNVDMLNNTSLTVNELNDTDNIVRQHLITYLPTSDPIDITTLVKIINSEFSKKGIELYYSYHKKIVTVNNLVDIKSVFIQITNKSTNTNYQLVGNNNIMQFMGVEYKWGSSDINVNDPQKTSISLFLSNTENPNLVTLTQDNKYPTMGMVKLTIPPKSYHQGNPFQVMNDNIMNFSVKRDSSEKWIFYNTDNNFFDNHPLHFHLTNGFVDKSETSPININTILSNALDVISIKYGSHIAFDLKFSHFDSTEGTIKHLGYMFHCHYMMHHDMNMMGQFYVEP